MRGMVSVERIIRGTTAYLVGTVVVLSLTISALAGAQEKKFDLSARLTPEVLEAIYPGADRVGPTEGEPPAAAVYKGDEIVAYLYSTLDIVAAPGYSSVPFDVIGGVGLDGVLTPAKVIYHKEPYVINNVVRQVLLDGFLAGHVGYKTRGSNTRLQKPDVVAGATVSARTMRAAIIDTARLVLRTRVPLQVVDKPTLDIESFRLTTWEELLEDGSFARRLFTNGEIADLFVELGGAGAAPNDALGAANETFIELYTGLLNPQSIGRNLFRVRAYRNYMAQWPDDGHIIVVGSHGPYDYKGTEFHKQENDNRFDRLSLLQGDTTVDFYRQYYQRLGSGGGEGIRSLETANLFYIPSETGFDPLQPWQLLLKVDGTGPAGPVAATVEMTYQLPERHILMPQEEPVAAWVEAWQDSRDDVAIMTGTLVVLTSILIFQTPLSRRPKVHRWVRNGFLLFVLVWVGGIAGAQLSIVNVMNYMLAPFRGFDVGFYLSEPIMIMVAGYTVVTLLLLGRGIFCGWLCPFGALQELLAQVARALRLPTWNPTEAVQKWLWLGKYVAAAVLIGLAFYSVEMATTASEIEPFKTAITAKFVRGWPFVIYAAALLTIGLFTERAYCRFLCPLGGTLAVLGRFHLFNNLKRRAECGSPCQLCTRSCPVKAIPQTGKIDMNECFQCLDCQVEYYDDRRCPPLAKNRKQRERALAGFPSPAPVLPGPMQPAAAE